MFPTYVLIFVWQMKKLFASILLLIYFTVNTGFVVSIHYCMDKVESVELGGISDECGNCGMKVANKACCKDDVKLIKMTVDQPVAKMIVTDFLMLLLQSIPAQFLTASFKNFSDIEHSIAHSPPLNELDIYLQNGVFRI